MMNLDAWSAEVDRFADISFLEDGRGQPPMPKRKTCSIETRSRYQVSQAATSRRLTTPRPHPLPDRSPWLFRLFRRYAKRYVAQHFHAVRVSRTGPVPELPRRPAIVAMNHPSWWDPLIGLVLTEHLPEFRTHFAPIDTHGLAQYQFLGRLGFFGVEPDTPRGGRAFLRICESITSGPNQ